MKIPSFRLDGPSWEVGRLGEIALRVKRGVMPVASIAVHRRSLPVVRGEFRRIRRDGVRILQFPVGDTHVEIVLYRHPHLRDVILAAYDRPHDAEVVLHWTRGKMYGYGEAEIGEYIASRVHRRHGC